MKKSLSEAKPLYLYLLSLAFIFLSKFVERDYETMSYILTGVAFIIFIFAIVKHFRRS